MKKRDELRDPNSCLNKAASHEPIFVLRAKDPLAARAVLHWVAMADDEHETEKLEEAINLAKQMEQWRDHHFGTCAEATGGVES